jgi:hypothetical protein
MSETIVITGPEHIERYRWLAVRTALKLEIRGLRRHGRSARQIANEITGQNHRTAVQAYAALNDRIVTELGPEFGRPLPPVTQS